MIRSVSICTGIIFLCLWLSTVEGFGQKAKKIKEVGDKQIKNIKDSTMKVEIWSDVMCPFCYIGKRKFEKALKQFPESKNIEIVWKSFQLNPDMKTEPDKNISQYLAEVKGWTLDYAKQANAQVTAMAAGEGLQYNMDKAVVANSFDAHRFVQLAKKNGKGDEAEEQLFKAYFTDGKNIADHKVLLELGISIGLDSAKISEVLNGNLYAEEVQRDIYESRQVGVRGVPFFVFNQKYAISGAQDSQVFLNALNKSWSEFEKEIAKSKISVTEGPVCTPDGECDPVK